MLKFFWPGPDEHVSHEESMVGTSADNSHVDSIAFIPSGKSVDNINSAAGI